MRIIDAIMAAAGVCAERVMGGGGNEDSARLHSAADMLTDTQYTGSLPDA